MQFRRWFVGLFVVVVCWLAFSIPVHAAQQLAQHHVPRITRHLTPIGRLDSNTRLHLAIGLPLRNREKLTNLLEEIYRPGGANFRHFLSADEFAASFGPTEADYRAVINFAKSHNLTVEKTHSNRTLLDVSGSVGDIEKAFHVHMQVYKHPIEARTFFAPDTEPTVDLATPLLAISGLDDYVTPRPLIHAGGVRPQVRPFNGGSGGGGGGNTNGCTGGGTGSGTWGYAGSDFEQAYLPITQANGTPNGAGQSVGLFELSGYSLVDIQTYEQEYSVSDITPTNVLIDKFDGSDHNEDFAFECTSDIEMAIAMAPSLGKLYVYEGAPPVNNPPAIQYSSTTAEINDVFNRMAIDDTCSQLSCSYGFDINLSTVQIFQQFAVQGQSLFQASGDSGAYAASIPEPIDDPYVTVVGGTDLTTDTNGYWCSEAVWLTPAQYDPLLGYIPFGASGGGISFTYGIPDWQQGTDMTTNQGSTTMRNVPDVASVADGVDIVYGNDDPNFYNTSVDYPVSGTSLAAPVWAAFMAMVNQQAAANGQPPIGFVNPALYAIGNSTNYNACFHDIIVGNNEWSNSPTKYSAATGYDLCTGWGTINDPLLDALLSPPAESLIITPPVGFTSDGPGGGPFSVTNQTYTLTNIGSTSLNWSLVSAANWLAVSNTSGTLAPGASTTVTVSLNSVANNFLISSPSANVTFKNLSDGTFQNREFDLYVGNGGFEDGDFTYWKLVGDTNANIVLAADDVTVAGTNALIGVNGSPDVPDEYFVHSGLYGGFLGQVPPAASLSHGVATRPGQQYVVSFWLSCATNTPGTNYFAVKWNGSTIYNQTNLPVFTWTNLQFTVPATGVITTLEFDFYDSEGAFGLDDVTVAVVPPLGFQSTALSGTNVVLSWPVSAAGYQLQSNTNLSTTNWVTITPVLSTNGSAVSTLIPRSGGQNFFRLKQ